MGRGKSTGKTKHNEIRNANELKRKISDKIKKPNCLIQ